MTCLRALLMQHGCRCEQVAGGRSSHPLAGIDDQGQLDYLLLDDDKLNSLPGAQTVLPSRGRTDHLCYYAAGVKPVIAAASLMTGAAGIWGWLKSILQFFNGPGDRSS